MVPKFAERLQHFSNTDKLLKQILRVRIFLNWFFRDKNSFNVLVLCDLRLSNFVEQHQYFVIFQQFDWEFEQDAAFKKLVSFITAGIQIQRWIKTLVS